MWGEGGRRVGVGGWRRRYIHRITLKSSVSPRPEYKDEARQGKDEGRVFLAQRSN